MQRNAAITVNMDNVLGLKCDKGLTQLFMPLMQDLRGLKLTFSDSGSCSNLRKVSDSSIKIPCFKAKGSDGNRWNLKP